MIVGKVRYVYPGGLISTHTRSLLRAERAVKCCKCPYWVWPGSYYTLSPAANPICQECAPWVEPWDTSYVGDPEWVRPEAR